jgi:hypothetical protein
LPNTAGTTPPLTSAEASRESVETSVRQLIANGKEKTALDRAKDLHKTCHDAASEALLIDAYVARIRSLSRQNLHLEAKALVDLVRERFPAAAARLEGAANSASARSGDLDPLLRTLADPATSPERRAEIEILLAQNVLDVSTIASSEALPASHPLRQAAAAVEQAFTAVTTGPVTNEQIALPEVSRRSPLAPWKLLIRAIAAMHCNDDVACGQYLDAIDPASAPARLIPVVRQIAAGHSNDAPLTGVAGDLVNAVKGGQAALKRSFDRLDAAFRDAAGQRQIVDNIRAATRECTVYAPDLVPALRQRIAVKCTINDINRKHVEAAMGGSPSMDASLIRMMARALESTGDIQMIGVACKLWDDFRTAAVRELWFAADSLEMSVLYLHMAAVASRLPEPLVAEMAREERRRTVDPYYLEPRRLFDRACKIDRHTETYSQWFRWARQTIPWEADRIAKAWSKALPGDLEPLLFLIGYNERMGAFGVALEYLRKAEKIDSLHVEVRNARIPLLGQCAMSQIQQKKPWAAELTLNDLAQLPQIQQGDRAALVPAFRYVVHASRGDQAEAAAQRAEVQRVLGDPAAASLLLAGIAAGCRRSAVAKPGPVGKLDGQAAADLLAALLRVKTLLSEIGSEWHVPAPWVTAAFRQFSNVRRQFDTDQLRGLGRIALDARKNALAYAVSTEGLSRGGADEALFLLLRAEALRLGEDPVRADYCAAAALQLARQAGNEGIAGDALDLLRRTSGSEGPPLDLTQAQDILRQEKQALAFPTARNRGPDYSGLHPCDCPKCRRERGEAVDPDDPDLDDDEDDFDPFDDLPPDMPPRFTGKAPFKQFLESIFVNIPKPGRPRKKAKRKK